MKDRWVKKMALVLAALMFVAGVATGCGKTKASEVSAENPLVFRMALVDGESTNYYRGAMEIAHQVFAKTGGCIKIEVIPGGALGGERDTVELAMAGDLDIATAANSVLTNWIPEMAILDQAYLWDNADQAHAAVDGEVGELIEEKAEDLGLHVVGYMESGFRDVFSKTAIEKPEDFKGVKIRTMQNQYHIAAFSAFGAMPTSMSSSEQFTALQQGTIDAVENSVSNCYANGYYEITKNITNSEHAFVYILLCMSDRSYQMIPEDLRDPFNEGVEAGYKAQRGYLQEANEEAVVKLKAEGVAFHEIDKAALKKTYEAEVARQGFTFDPQWEAAVNRVITENRQGE